MAVPDPLNDALARGALLFDAGAFFEAHEAWEERWRVETDPGSRLCLQGLIQIAAGFHKLVVLGSPASASRLLSKGLAKLDACAAPAESERMRGFRSGVRACAQALAGGRFDQLEIPKLGSRPWADSSS